MDISAKVQRTKHFSIESSCNPATRVAHVNTWNTLQEKVVGRADLRNFLAPALAAFHSLDDAHERKYAIPGGISAPFSAVPRPPHKVSGRARVGCMANQRRLHGEDMPGVEDGDDALADAAVVAQKAALLGKHELVGHASRARGPFPNTNFLFLPVSCSKLSRGVNGSVGGVHSCKMSRVNGVQKDKTQG